MTRVKICGITEPAQALTAAEAGADFIGLVMAPSSRQLSPERARHIAAAVRQSKASPQVVGVFVNLPPQEVNRIAEYCGLDWVQLSGDEPWEDLHCIDRPVIRAIGVRSEQDSDEILAAIRDGREQAGEGFIPLLDCHVEGRYGGSGQSFDWTVATRVSRQVPVILAGGLSPANVGEAMRTVSPWGVDVSSGVETDGVKDTFKIKRFVEVVREEDGR